MLFQGRCRYFLIVLFSSWLMASCSNNNNEETDQIIADFVISVSVNAGETTITGQITSTDSTLGSTLLFEVTGESGPPDGFTLNSDGSYSFNPANSSYFHLSDGDTEEITILVTVTDDQGAAETTEIKITVTGTNDAPVAVVAVTTSVEEGAEIILGQLTFIDADDDSMVVFSITGDATAPAGFALESDGRYSFDPADTAYDHLNVGDSEVLTIPVTVTDDKGATDTTQIQITVMGTNDAPDAGVDVTHSVDEGAITITGQLGSTDVDDGSTASFVITGAVSPTGFALNGDGSYSFNPADIAYDHLNVGDSEVVTIPITVSDDQLAIDTTQIQIFVTGTNDALVAGADVTLDVDEGAANVTGQLTFTDVDDSATATFEITGGVSAPTGFSLDADGSYSFDPADSVYDHLNVINSEVLTIPVTVTDDQGATDTTQIQITVMGTNDDPDADVDVTLSVDVGAAPVTGQLTSSDVDDGATATFSITEGTSAPVDFSLNSDGSYRFDPAITSYAHLDAGVSEVLIISITVTDDQGATDALQILITVTGVNNIPDVADDTYSTFGNTQLEVGVLPGGSIAVAISGSVLDNDVDLDVLDILTVELETASVSGTVTINTQGHFTYVPFTGQTSVTDSFSYRASDGTGSAVATVTIDITKRIWYVDNSNAGGTGVSNDPFDTLVDSEMVAEDGDYIYIAFGDGTVTGQDSGLTLAVPNVSVIGEGEALVIDSITLVTAGSAPTITNTDTNTDGSGFTVNSADNTLIKGLIIDAVLADGLVINDSIGIELEAITISNSGESAIQGSGVDVGLMLTDVIIDTVDVTDSTNSDDAIFITSTSSSSLVMSGGSINGVPGNLGDGIVFENAVAANVVSMNLDVSSVTFSGIAQDGIKLDNENGVIDVQIGGITALEGNIFDVGFRGVQIQTDADPTLNRTNRILIQNNNFTSVNESIQIRNIADITHLSILDNSLTLAPGGDITDLIDVQTELMSDTQARINNNDISNANGSDGIKLKIFDGATLTIEASNNMIDGPIEGFDFDVIETDSTAINPTTLNTSLLNNTLSNIVSQALNARNANVTSNTCLDLRGNTENYVGTVYDYVLDAITGIFLLASNPQPTVLDPSIGSIVSSTVTCPVPTF